MKRLMAGVCLLAFAPLVSFAEGATAFEVASIKPAAQQEPGRIQVSMGGDPGRIDYKGVSLKNLIERAYSVKSYQVTGPDFLERERFDVAAKLPEGASQSDVPRMLQTLLEERFKLVVHREEKTLPIYALVVAKGGLKMQKVEGDPGPIRLMVGPNGPKLETKATIDGLAGVLSRLRDCPVIDATGLKDTFDMKLEWRPDGTEAGMIKMAGPGGEARSSENSEGSLSLLTAVQEQLGLKMEARKAPVQIVVVDSVEKAPTGN